MTDTRTAYIEGIRALAYLLEANPDLPLPHALNGRTFQWFVHDDIETVLMIRALLFDAVTALYDSVRGNFPVEVTGTLAGFPVSVLIARDIALAPGEGFIAPAPAMNPRLLAADPVSA